jgi:hypothetical protein
MFHQHTKGFSAMIWTLFFKKWPFLKTGTDVIPQQKYTFSPQKWVPVLVLVWLNDVRAQ